MLGDIRGLDPRDPKAEERVNAAVTRKLREMIDEGQELARLVPTAHVRRKEGECCVVRTWRYSYSLDVNYFLYCSITCVE